MNERFNRKLIEHGTDKGVPESELPDPSSILSSLQAVSMKRRAEGGANVTTAAAPTTQSSGNYASSCYQLRQKVAQRPPSGYNRKVNNGAASTTALNPNMKIEEPE